MDPTNNPSSSANHQGHPHPHNKHANLSPFMRYWLMSSTSNSPATTPEVSRPTTPIPTPPHHHSTLPPPPPPTPVDPRDLPRPPILPSRTNSSSSIASLPQKSQCTTATPPSGRPMTASSLPTNSESSALARAAAGKPQLKKGQSSSKSWDFLVHGALL